MNQRLADLQIQNFIEVDDRLFFFDGSKVTELSFKAAIGLGDADLIEGLEVCMVDPVYFGNRAILLLDESAIDLLHGFAVVPHLVALRESILILSVGIALEPFSWFPVIWKVSNHAVTVFVLHVFYK